MIIHAEIAESYTSPPGTGVALPDREAEWVQELSLGHDRLLVSTRMELLVPMNDNQQSSIIRYYVSDTSRGLHHRECSITSHSSEGDARRYILALVPSDSESDPES